MNYLRFYLLPKKTTETPVTFFLEVYSSLRRGRRIPFSTEGDAQILREKVLRDSDGDRVPL